jgi:hypothetical protein
MIRRELTILVGDAHGADKAVQTYFAEHHYSNVLVFCTAGDCRNNVGGWPVRTIEAPHRVRDFAFFTAKDAAMTDEADVGWPCGTVTAPARSSTSRVSLPERSPPSYTSRRRRRFRR